MKELKLYKIHMGKASCAVDIGDGSERGEYVSQDYMINKLGRPHRAISIMYCYYPYDEGWPCRASEVHKREREDIWGFPYDDYFTYKGGINGNTNDEPFNQMRDIRRHGQDVILTLTIDPNVTDDHLIAIAKDLRPFGQMFIRINHEATGNWFEFNKRCTYQEVADFYTRFHKIIKQYAPNVSTILCAGGVDESTGKIEKEEEFFEAFQETDIWSLDRYLALHWGWPFDIADDDTNKYGRSSEEEVYDYFEKSFNRFTEINNGVKKPFTLSELNTDGDVAGTFGQAESIEKFYGFITDRKPEWLNSVCMYQFRDRGRLGLEFQDPNNAEIGIEQPLFHSYKKIISNDYFRPVISTQSEISLPAVLRWGSSEDAEGLKAVIEIKERPEFCELHFDEDDDSNLMIEFNGKWFYKAPKTKFVDLMPVFSNKPKSCKGTYDLNIFAPPPTGENDLSISDGLYNFYSHINSVPYIRIRYSSVK
ncbi:MAG: hypothetical protein IJP18_03050 [Oscillospiraceae bacterium]|nr:hypothetical protein [Oscillospiraceae bacterium]